MANGNDWQKKYPEEYHAGIGEFLRKNPGDIERIPDLSFVESGGEDWGDYAQWEGRTFDPTGIPPAIGPTELPPDDYGLAFRPGVLDEDYRGMSDFDWMSGQPWGDDVKTPGDPMPRTMPDLLGLGTGENVPGSMQALQQAGYTFAKPQLGQTDWTIYDPEGNIAPWALTYGGDDDGNGEEECDPGFHRDQNGQCVRDQSPVSTTPTAQELCLASGGTWDGYECKQPVSGITADQSTVLPTTELPAEWGGDPGAREDVIPFMPQEFEDLSTMTVGDDPLSLFANADLASLMSTGGVAPTPLAGNLEQTLQDIIGGRGVGAEAVSPLGEQVLETASKLIDSGGRLPPDVQRRAMELESARSPIDALRQSQLAEGQAALAARGLLGSGPELDYMQRLEENLAPAYAQAGQALALSERDREEARYLSGMELGARTSLEQAQMRENRLSQALSTAAGLSMEQSRNLLSTVDTLTERQKMLNDVALQTLDRNMEWNKFLAEYGLQRSQALEMVQTGRINQILPMLQQYLEGASLAAGGYIGPS